MCQQGVVRVKPEAEFKHAGSIRNYVAGIGRVSRFLAFEFERISGDQFQFRLRKAAIKNGFHTQVAGFQVLQMQRDRGFEVLAERQRAVVSVGHVHFHQFDGFPGTADAGFPFHELAGGAIVVFLEFAAAVPEFGVKARLVIVEHTAHHEVGCDVGDSIFDMADPAF